MVEARQHALSIYLAGQPVEVGLVRNRPCHDEQDLAGVKRGSKVCNGPSVNASTKSVVRRLHQESLPVPVCRERSRYPSCLEQTSGPAKERLAKPGATATARTVKNAYK